MKYLIFILFSFGLSLIIVTIIFSNKSTKKMIEQEISPIKNEFDIWKVDNKYLNYNNIDEVWKEVKNLVK